MGNSSFLSVLNRDLTDSEKRYFRRWISQGLSLELIIGAYEMTVIRTDSVSFAYMNALLQNWHSQGMRTMEEVRSGKGTGPKESDKIAVKWAEVRKELFSPDELVMADCLIELRQLYDGIMVLQEKLAGQHHDAEIGCLDYKVVKALAATYELQDYLASRIALFDDLQEE